MTVEPHASQNNGRLVSLSRLRSLRALQKRLPRFEQVDEVLELLRREWPMLFDVDDRATSAEIPPESDNDIAVRLRHAEAKVAQLHTALISNRRIGAATGILMARLKLPEHDSFELMRAASQRQRRKLVDIAAEVVWTGALPQNR
ncbi:MAG: Response regulator receiver and domain protein [Mycobacterium sp.]|nr:Response regulator receiver and domain protein [Mycobacterium sp.]